MWSRFNDSKQNPFSHWYHDFFDLPKAYDWFIVNIHTQLRSNSISSIHYAFFLFNACTWSTIFNWLLWFYIKQSRTEIDQWFPVKLSSQMLHAIFKIPANIFSYFFIEIDNDPMTHVMTIAHLLIAFLIANND